MEEACQHVASIAEDDLNVHVLSGLHNLGHESWGRQINTHLQPRIVKKSCILEVHQMTQTMDPVIL